METYLELFLKLLDDIFALLLLLVKSLFLGVKQFLVAPLRILETLGRAAPSSLLLAGVLLSNLLHALKGCLRLVHLVVAEAHKC